MKNALDNSAISAELIFPTNLPKDMMVTTRNVVKTDKTIDEGGLFSTEIFGMLGSDSRFEYLGAIELHTDIIHPRIASYLENNKLYKGIMSGNVKVKLIDGEFVPDENGETGYQYFVKNFSKIKFKKFDSLLRQQEYEVIEKYRLKNKVTIQSLIVIPAGLREFEIENDMLKYDDINKLYLKIINVSDVLSHMKDDILIYKLHNLIMDVYKYISGNLFGKKKFINKDVMSRAFDYGSRNVITGQVIKYDNIEDIPYNIMDYFEIGLAQYLSNIEPIVLYEVSNMFYQDFITDGLLWEDRKPTTRTIPAKFVDKFSKSNIGDLIRQMRTVAFRTQDVEIDGRYLAYIVEEEETIKVYLPNTTETLPDEARPIKYAEMLYLAVVHRVNDTPIYSTRYPIAYANSDVVGLTELYTTVENEYRKPKKFMLYHLHEKDMGEVKHFPEKGAAWFDSFIVSHVRLSEYDADFDGDALSSGNLMTKEAGTEIKEKLQSPSYYRGFELSIDDKISTYAYKTLTRR